MDPNAHVPLVAGPAYIERFDLTAVAVYAAGEKIGYLPPELSGHYFGAIAAEGVECQGRRAPLSARENTGVEVLLDLNGVPCEA
jgi:hypothetical protein